MIKLLHFIKIQGSSGSYSYNVPVTMKMSYLAQIMVLTLNQMFNYST